MPPRKKLAGATCTDIVLQGGNSTSSDLVTLSRPSTEQLLELRQQLTQHHGPRSTLAANLLALHRAGLLVESITGAAGSTASVRRSLQRAMEFESEVKTPYGKVVQTLRIDHPQLRVWEFAHPLALIHHLCNISPDFADVMASCITPGVPLRIVLYVDACEPGDPLRPDANRNLQCIYMCVVDWPQWLLQRSGAWLNIGFIRTTVVNALPGGLSGLMGRLLHLFFSPDVSNSFARGLCINVRDSCITTKGKFSGFLADDSCHTHLSSIVGSSGIHICIECENVVHRLDADVLADGLVPVACSDPGLFKRRDDKQLFDLADELVELNRTNQKTALKKFQTENGVKFMPGEMLFCTMLRQLYKPVKHTIRDWMHIFCSGGVANIHIGLLLHVLTAFGFTVDVVMVFVLACTLPHKWGKRASKDWIKKSRLKHDHLASFASIILTIAPILLAFLNDVVSPQLPDHILCFKLLVEIIGLLSLGPEGAMQYINLLEEKIQLHRGTLRYSLSTCPKAEISSRVPYS